MAPRPSEATGTTPAGGSADSSTWRRGRIGGFDALVDSSELPSGEPLPAWAGRFVHSDNLTFAYYEIAPDAAPLHQHSHPQEEVWNVVDGELAITIDGVERVVASGCAAIVPANTPHSAGVLGACGAIVVDYPTRDEVGGVQTAG